MTTTKPQQRTFTRVVARLAAAFRGVLPKSKREIDRPIVAPGGFCGGSAVDASR